MATTDLCWWPLSAWISPGVALFVFFNVLVGTIAVMSREQAGDGPASSRRRLCRSASSMVLDLFQSFSVHPAAECYYHTSVEADEKQVMNRSASQQPVPETAAAEPQPQIEPAEALAADAAAWTMSVTHKNETDSSQEKPTTGEGNVQDEDQQYQAPGSLSPPAPAAAEVDEATAAVERPGKKKPRKEVPQRYKRRERESSRKAEGKAELNTRADLFIRQFREDLKLQRLNSIINYTYELRRRAGVALSQD